MFNKLTATASANDTFGEDNTKRFNELTTGTPETLAKVIEEDKAFQNYRNRIRRSYGYKAGGADSGQTNQSAGDLNDSLLYMYFDKALDKQ